MRAVRFVPCESPSVTVPELQSTRFQRDPPSRDTELTFTTKAKEELPL